MIRRIAVVVPAADEEAAVGACLSALALACAGTSCAVRVVVVLDNCTDDTARVVASFPSVESVHVDVRNVGLARRTGVSHVLSSEPDLDELLVASTDADSQVPADWLTLLVQLAATADLVLGMVVPDSDLPVLIEAAWSARHEAVDGHPHVHAANLAIRAPAYVRLGGWRALECGEDEDLVERATRARLRIARTALSPVRTSTRAFGRAPRGFSGYLRTLGHV